ncbi:recombinase family protein [[Clostridium] symbiosum]|uniref:recombinase family protein n=1 Tax=Clostridium symbiosum TaxID=1512 RepID=UPI001D07BE88|nr:recombinase family protein [[Clostridium] symbiosum]MCB6610177.1 recombinase family protein [[Clostridium] symbiosum]MCB6933513.1 recombinase family protein [[Clostridium] symbiosum]
MRRKYKSYKVQKDEKTKKVVAIYIRVSTLDQAVEGLSLDAQENKLRKYCKDRGYEVHDLYADRGISAKDIEHRPELQRLLQDAKKDIFDLVLVWKLSRFSRCLSDLLDMCEEMEEHGVYLTSYSEPFDSSTPMGRFIRNILGLVAQFEREIIAENVMLVMQDRAEQGKRTCSYVLGYDRHDKDSFTINEHEAEYVLFATRTYLERKNLSEVANLCKERGYKGKKGKEPTPFAVMQIITNPLYCGYNRFLGKLYRGMHPRLISVETHNKIIRTLRAQGKLVGRSRIYELYYIKE